MNLEKMTVRELRELAEELGIAVAGDIKKQELIALIESKKAGEGEEKAPETDDVREPEKSRHKVYVGPSIPGGILSHGKILYGTETSIREYLAPVLERFPKVAGLMVSLDHMSDAMKAVKNPKKLLYHRAQELASEIKRNGG